jgi:hypothetical protein
VIGRPLRRATEAQARAAIAGITCVNDVTARDLQRSDEQWTRAKGFDTFCPIGPRLVPVDAARLTELEVRCRVNGVERQHGRARDILFGFRPGPHLPGHDSRTGRFDRDRDAVGVGPLHAGTLWSGIPGVGVLRNPVVAAKGAFL